MFGTIAVWILSSAVVFVGLVSGRTSVLQRRLRLGDLNWKAALVASALVGAVPAFVYAQLSEPRVEVPEDLGSRVAVPASQP